MLLILTIGIIFIQYKYNSDNLILDVIAPLISIIFFILSLLLFLLNPGIIYSDKTNLEKAYCGRCKFYYPKFQTKLGHCRFCEVCVNKFHHHCTVVSKCVGKYNMIIFMSFVATSSAFLLCLYYVFYSAFS